MSYAVEPREQIEKYQKEKIEADLPAIALGDLNRPPNKEGLASAIGDWNYPSNLDTQVPADRGKPEELTTKDSQDSKLTKMYDAAFVNPGKISWVDVEEGHFAYFEQKKDAGGNPQVGFDVMVKPRVGPIHTSYPGQPWMRRIDLFDKLLKEVENETNKNDPANAPRTETIKKLVQNLNEECKKALKDIEDLQKIVLNESEENVKAKKSKIETKQRNIKTYEELLNRAAGQGFEVRISPAVGQVPEVVPATKRVETPLKTAAAKAGNPNLNKASELTPEEEALKWLNEIDGKNAFNLEKFKQLASNLSNEAKTEFNEAVFTKLIYNEDFTNAVLLEVNYLGFTSFVGEKFQKLAYENFKENVNAGNIEKAQAALPFINQDILRPSELAIFKDLKVKFGNEFSKSVLDHMLVMNNSLWQNESQRDRFISDFATLAKKEVLDVLVRQENNQKLEFAFKKFLSTIPADVIIVARGTSFFGKVHGAMRNIAQAFLDVEVESPNNVNGKIPEMFFDFFVERKAWGVALDFISGSVIFNENLSNKEIKSALFEKALEVPEIKKILSINDEKIGEVRAKFSMTPDQLDDGQPPISNGPPLLTDKA